MDDELLLKQWNLDRFYTKVKYLAWLGHSKKEYNRIMNEKMKTESKK